MGGRTVVVVGAGLAGLRCAELVERAGHRAVVLEAADAPGGRIRTDVHEEFLLDRGFQVYLTGYEEAGRVLDLEALELGRFRAGAWIRTRNGRTQRLLDPLRHPVRGLESVVRGPGTAGDLLRLGRRRLRAGVSSPWERQGRESTATRLASEGYSPALIDRFFRPFFGGVFLDARLSTSAAMFEFLFDVFSRGHAALPAEGMEAIPRQLAGRIRGPIRTGARVVSVEPGRATLASGERVEGAAVVVATALPEARWLAALEDDRDTRATFVFYYAAPTPPIREPVLLLNGTGEGPVNHVCVPSEVSAGYAPEGQALVSVTVLDARSEDGLGDRVRAQLGAWFGPRVGGWRLLRSYRIADALPAQPPGSLAAPRPARLAPGLYVAGDHRTHGSIEGALVSGRRAAEALLAELATA
jgi:phytoene dehydrogenase-like protein